MAVFPAVFGLLMAALVTGQSANQVDIIPKEVVVREGEEQSVICKVGYRLTSCRFMIGNPPKSYILSPGANNDADVVYAGQGLDHGECGALLKNVQQEWNGRVTCMVPPESGNVEESGEMRLIVAKQPQPPQLSGPTDPYFKEGYNFLAECSVPDGRPAAQIHWFLNDTEYFQGLSKPNITYNPSTDLQSISQTINLELMPDHNGVTLECRANHTALSGPLVAKRQLIVHYPPKRVDASPSITIFGLKLGAAGRLNVSVRANPAPRALWRVNDLTLRAPMADEAGTVAALDPVFLGDGYYNISLHLSHISKEDVDRKYYLTVNNDLGQQEYTVMISTMAEPVGVELDTGAIVGIVVAVLILLAAVSLTVFAKATDRWCFAGGSRGRDHAKSSGESSDTESAVGGKERSRLAGLSARVRAVLPRAKDKVQATEVQAADTEEKPLSDDKKNVVYAELQLGEQTSTEKPAPPSTEYAEIVYTDQPKESKE